jgi:hypothetical protein
MVLVRHSSTTTCSYSTYVSGWYWMRHTVNDDQQSHYVTNNKLSVNNTKFMSSTVLTLTAVAPTFNISYTLTTFLPTCRSH